MSYKSPIELIQQQMRSQIDDCIYKAVMNVGVNVDKEELIKALAYDRDQYKRGYDDRDAEIIRCKDCRYHDAGENEVDAWNRCRKHRIDTDDDEFCSWAVRKGEKE